MWSSILDYAKKALEALKASDGLWEKVKDAAKKVVLWFSKQAGRIELQKEIDKANAEKQKEYDRLAGEPRDPDTTSDRMRDGTF